LSQNTSVVLWLIIASIGRIATPCPQLSRKKTDNPSVRRLTSSTGFVRANSSIRSEWRAREVQTFWPLTI